MKSTKTNVTMKWLIILIIAFLIVGTAITIILINRTFYVASYDDLTSEKMQLEIEYIEKCINNAGKINNGTMKFESDINSIICEATVEFEYATAEGICRRVTATLQDKRSAAERREANESDLSEDYTFEVQLQPRKYYLFTDGKKEEVNENGTDWNGISYIDRQVIDVSISDAFWHGIGGISVANQDIKEIEKYRQGRNTIYKIEFTQDAMGYELIAINHNDVVTAVEYYWVYQENHCYRKVTVLSSSE